MPNVQSLVDEIRVILVDADADIYEDSFIKNALYSAELTLASHRFDSTAANLSFTCEAGARQELSNSQGLLSVSKARRVSREDLDAFSDWESAPSGKVKEYTYDDREPLAFYLNPPSPVDQVINVTHSQIPVPYGTETTVSEKYRQPLIEFTLYKLLSSDTEGSVNVARAGQHINNFYQLLGMNYKAQKTQSPKSPESKR